MTDADLLVELERQFEERAETPFSLEEGALIAKLSFTSRSLTPETFRDAWNGFLEELRFEELEWPIHFGVALWYWEHEMPCSAPHLSSGYELSAVAGKVLLFDLTRCPIPEC